MKNLLVCCGWLLLLVVCFAGCEEIIIQSAGRPDCAAAVQPCPFQNVPPVDLPRSMRARNYSGGSCAHASMQDVLRWQNLNDHASWWRRNHRGGANLPHTLAGIANRRGLDYAMTTDGDPAFLGWCSRTRRGAAIIWSGGSHAITFCGFIDGKAVLIDNNNPYRRRLMNKKTFLAHWRGSGGDAITPVYAPAAPRPWIPIKRTL